MTNKVNQYLSPRDVARIFMVSPITVRSWAEKGWLSAETTAGGHRRYAREELERFAAKRGLRMKPSTRAELQVLIVDDDRELANFFAVSLRALNPDVKIWVAHDGFEAGLLVHQLMPDVVLLDLIMPNVDGFQVCERIKTDPALRAIRVIAMTAYPSPETIERIVAAGAEACLEKPLDIQTLYQSLRLEPLGIRVT